MKTILAILLFATAAAAQADEVLKAYSYACKYERHLDELGAAKWSGDHKARDMLIAKRECFLINRAARVRIIFVEDKKAHFRALKTGDRLWTWSRNIERTW